MTSIDVRSVLGFGQAYDRVGQWPMDGVFLIFNPVCIHWNYIRKRLYIPISHFSSLLRTRAKADTPVLAR
jgi:hypothetical protein